MKCEATIKGGKIVSVVKVADSNVGKPSCFTFKGGKAVLIEGLKDGTYYCPKQVWKERVRDLGKAKSKEVAAKPAKAEKKEKK